MSIDIPSCLRGVMVAAVEAKPELKPVVLRDDVRRLSQLIPAVSSEALDISALVPSIHAWLAFRSQNPDGVLPGDIASPVSGSAKRAKIDDDLARIGVVIAEFPDQKLAGLVAGAQCGLSYFKEQLPGSLLARDWEDLSDSYDAMLALYTGHSLSEDLSRELIVYEYAGLRLASVGNWLSWPRLERRIIDDPRYGTLEVQTNPTAASVWVNENAWGTSPVINGVRAGKHGVKAEREGHTASDTVVVRPARLERITLHL